METFAIRFRNARTNKNLTQAEVALRMGFKNKSSIGKIENGKQSLTHDQVKQAAEIFGVTPMYLMGWDTEKTVQVKYDLLNEENKKTVLGLIDYLLAQQEAKQ